MWLSTELYGQKYSMEYGSSTPGVSAAPWKLDLDPIEVAGTFKYELLGEYAFTRQAIQLLNPEGMAEVPEKSTRTSKEYTKHLNQLVKYGVLEHVQGEPATGSSRFFAVAKSNGLARTIFNGKYVSGFLEAAPPVNLAPWPLLVNTLAERAWVAVQGDVRHYFHQIRVGKQLSKLLTVATEEGHHYRFRVLPMGLSFSPWIAQSLCWSVLLRTLDNLGMKHNVPPEAEFLPSLLIVEEPAIRIFLLYDNILMLCESLDVARKLENTLKAECRALDLHLKELEIITPNKMRREGMKHLGCHFEYGRHGLLLRRPDATVERWKPFLEGALEEPWTYRRVSRVIGMLMFDTYMRGLPLLERQEELSLLREVCKERKGKKSGTAK